MARPPKVAPNIFDVPPGAVGQEILSESVSAAQGFIPASVTSSWDDLRHTLGRTVPHNVTEAKASARRLRTLG